MKNLSVNISYFHQFSPIFWIFWHLLVSKKLMTSAYNRWCSHFFHFYRFFNNCIKLCWYYISSSWNMKEGGGKIEIDLPAEKTTLKKPSLIRVNVIKDWTIAREKTMLISEKIFKFSLLLSFYFFFFFFEENTTNEILTTGFLASLTSFWFSSRGFIKSTKSVWQYLF